MLTIWRLNKNKNYENNIDKECLSNRTEKCLKFKAKYADNKYKTNNDKENYKKEKKLIFENDDLVVKKSNPVNSSKKIQTFIDDSDSVEIAITINNKEKYENELKKLTENDSVDIDQVIKIQSSERDLHSKIRFVNNKEQDCLSSNLKTEGKVLKELEINKKGDVVYYEHKVNSEWTGLKKDYYSLNDSENLIIKIEDIDSSKSNIVTRTVKAAGGFTKEEIKSYFKEHGEYFDQD